MPPQPWRGDAVRTANPRRHRHVVRLATGGIPFFAEVEATAVRGPNRHRHHRHWQVLTALDTPFVLLLPDRELALPAWSATALAPGVEHGVRAAPGRALLRFLDLRLDPVLHPVLAAWLERHPGPAAVPRAEIAAVRALLAARPAPAAPLVLAAACRLVAGCAGLPPAADAPVDADPRLLAADSILDHRLVQPPRVAELAAHAGLSAAQFSRLHRAAFACSPAQRMRERRLALAADLLRAGLAVGAVARRCGWRLPHHFTRAFQRRFGMPPSRWRTGAGA